jgi:subtilase family serine protease
MTRTLNVVATAIALLGLAACDANSPFGELRTAGQPDAAAKAVEHARIWGPNVVAACPDRRRGEVQCASLIRIGPSIVRAGGSGPGGGFTPPQLQAAYDLPSASKGSGETVAIVDAYDNPDVASDLASYRSYFGLPAGNFTKYNQAGQTGNYPSGNVDWGFEEDLDVDMVSASCPNCSIILVEANSNTTTNLGAAEEEAVTLGAHIVTNSWGCSESLCITPQSYFDAAGVTYLAAAGDEGYGDGVWLPAAFVSVVSVGGTSLYTDPKRARGYREKAWLGTISGCSTQTKPSWQHDPGCSYRTTNDIAAIADPATGPEIYDTYGWTGWLVGGGTSAASPFLAGIFALAGNASSQHGGKTFWNKKRHSKDLFPVEHGYNGSCAPLYLCTDGTHEYGTYGGPTGWGTPNGIGAF